MAEKEELTRLLYVRSNISRAGKEPKPRGSSHRRFRLEREGEGGGRRGEGGGEGERGRQRGEEKEKRWGEGEERRMQEGWKGGSEDLGY